MPNETSHRYFVTFSRPGGITGSTEVALKYPIRSMADVRVIAEVLASSGAPDAVVTGWQRFED